MQIQLSKKYREQEHLKGKNFNRVSAQKSVDLSDQGIEKINFPSQNFNSSVDADRSLTPDCNSWGKEQRVQGRRKYLRNIKPKQRQTNPKDML